jgi:hypothetical protein
MPYYVRAFCTGDQIPPITAIIDDLRARGVDVCAEADDEATLASADWEQCWLKYSAAKQPIIVECNRDEGAQSLCRAECDEFVEQLEDGDETPAHRRCIDHLRATRFIIACQLLSDVEDEGFTVNGEFLGYFVRNCGGIVQADGEGFYDGDEIVAPTE